MSSRADHLRQALDMFTTGVGLMRQNLRRAAPDAPLEEIERRVTAWLRTRPGAARGDAPGQPACRIRVAP